MLRDFEPKKVQVESPGRLTKTQKKELGKIIDDGQQKAGFAAQ